ncbi:MAG: transcriptional regulator [Methanobrevibacter sp.]|uniref:transcriptional regulator n=1 Tax=Methanobrevibacter sp. TaxID=66852 RepID=UPI0025F3D7C4|nr:transcriptional regulator [Methanobrevibacter sp.]MBQ2613613.1 transcriptional regulator [Methanobrevibacter sp.]MEE0025209.1 transcriptional regulator [Methanobrevibacter sp.]
MKEEEIFDSLGYVMASTYRLSVIQYIGNGVKIPSDIARKIGVRTNHISNVLSDLKQNGLVICLNEDARKGRLYKNTELSLEILKYINSID